MKKERLIATAGVLAAAVAFVLFVPLPFSVKCTFEIQARDSQPVFTATPGQITLVSAKPGQSVVAGDPIMQLANPDLELEVVALDGRRREAEQKVDSLLKQRYTDPSAIDQLDMAREIRTSANKQYLQKKDEFDRLTIKAPATGTIIPLPSRPAKMASAPGRLRTWIGTPFDEKNLGALLTPTDQICIVGNPADVQAVLVVDQAYVGLVKNGQEVRMLLEADTHRAYQSQIESIGDNEVQAVSNGSSTMQGGRLETKTDHSGMVKPLSTSFPARALLGDSAGRLQVGMRGQARIYTGWQPLGRRLYRFMAKTFNFDL